MRRIVVGVDGSDPAVAALGWAVALARRTGARIEAVTVAAQMPLASPMGAMVELGDEALEQATRAMEHTLEQVDHDDVEIDTAVQDGQSSGVLLGTAEGADLLVLGTHGYSALESALLGSVSRQVVTHAVCPTVLVPSDPGQLERVVVGVDGSEESLHALRWAADLARDLGADVEVVAAYHYTPVGIGSPWVAPVPMIGDREMREAASDVLDNAVEKASAADVVVERTVAEGAAAARLQDRAQDADMLVVGSRGHGGFTGLLLGSVSRRCLAHPVGPVVVVPSH
jgi:nucleotide-binding universal stress UspA family protein